MHICYLLESVDLSGGVRVVFDQARALMSRGHRVTIRYVSGNCDWYPWPMSLECVPSLAALGGLWSESDGPDVVIATYWTTVDPAISIGCRRTFHLCQGYEGIFPELMDKLSSIEAAYHRRVPKLVIGPWLTVILRQHYTAEDFPIYEIGQIVDSDSFCPRKGYWWRPRARPMRVLVVGPREFACKGIEDALMAIELVRRAGIDVTLIRVSPLPQALGDNAPTIVNEYYHRLTTPAMAGVYRTSDVVISPSLHGEGFGLPAAEALASGLSVIATRIPSHEALSDGGRNLVLVPPSDPEALAAALRQLVENPWLYWRMRLRGPRFVRRMYSGEAVARRLEKIF